MKDWLPNWKDPDKYPDPKTTTTKMWAWEFLRRNIGYQSDYKRVSQYLNQIGYSNAFESLMLSNYHLDSDDLFEIKNQGSENLSEMAKIVSQSEEYVRPFITKYQVYDGGNDFLPDPSFGCIDMECVFRPGSGSGYYHRERRYARDSGRAGAKIKRMQPLEYLDIFKPERDLEKLVCEENISEEVRLWVCPRNLLVQISLEENINEQIQKIKELAKLQQKQLKKWGIVKISRKQEDYYREYLRCLDAIKAGAKKKEIVECLLPNDLNIAPDFAATKKINNWIVRAEKLRDREYLTLAGL